MLVYPWLKHYDFREASKAFTVTRALLTSVYPRLGLMSLSPSKSNTGQPSSDSHSLETNRLSLSQALIITAGLAGLLGLCGGAAIRFSLANSSNTRFLSPLQTFPELSNWASTPPQNAANAHYSSEDPESRGSNNSPTEKAIRMPAFDSMEPLSDTIDDSASATNDQIGLEDSLEEPEKFDITTFDAFAARDKASAPRDPLEALSKGPNWSRSD